MIVFADFNISSTVLALFFGVLEECGCESLDSRRRTLLQHPSSPPVRKEYHQRFGRRWIYVVGDSGAITAGSRTVGDVHPSPPVRIWNRW